jgi:hypothetical protein
VTRAPSPPVDLGSHERVVVVLLRSPQGRLCVLQLGPGLLDRGLGVVHVSLGNGTLGQERPEPRQIPLVVRERGLRLGYAGLSTLIIRFVGPGVDAEENGPLLHVGPLDVWPRHDYARHLSPHLDTLRGGGLRDPFELGRYRLWLDRQHGDDRRRWSGRRRLLTGGDRAGADRKEQEDPLECCHSAPLLL